MTAKERSRARNFPSSPCVRPRRRRNNVCSPRPSSALLLFLLLWIPTNASAAEPAASRDGDDEPPRHAGCAHLRDETHELREKLVGESYRAAAASSSRASPVANPGYDPSREAGPTAARCVGGRAGGYPCRDVHLLSALDAKELNAARPSSKNNAVMDVWGWTYRTRLHAREFALVCLQRGTAFVEITNPTNPIYLGVLPTRGGQHSNRNLWRDVKTYKDYAIIVSEIPRSGMQIFDLHNLLVSPSLTSYPKVFSAAATHDGFSFAHNVFVNEDTGYAYAVGTDECEGGMYIVDLRQTTRPVQAGCYAKDEYTHDAQCVIYNGPDSRYKNAEICFNSNEDHVAIVDVRSKSNPKTISKFEYKSGYTHQGWLTDDHRYFIFNDELDEYQKNYNTRTFVMDASDLSNPKPTGLHWGRTKAVDHNLYVKGDFVYQANYRAGFNLLRISDLSSAKMEEVGYFDIYPVDNDAGFNGAWSTYPFFQSGSVIVTGIEQGLFVLDVGSVVKDKTLPPSPSPVKPPVSSPVKPPVSSPVNSPCKDPKSYRYKWKKRSLSCSRMTRTSKTRNKFCIKYDNNKEKEIKDICIKGCNNCPS